MPGEQLRGEKETDHRADVYALGAILYEVLAGHLPHPGSNVQAIMYHILHEDPKPLDSLSIGVPQALALVVQKALARDPGDRHQSAAELFEALAPFADYAGEPIRTTPFVTPPVDTPPPISVIQPVHEEPIRPRRGLTKTIVALLVATLFAIGCVWALRLVGGSGHTAPTLKQASIRPALPPPPSRGTADVADEVQGKGETPHAQSQTAPPVERPDNRQAPANQATPHKARNQAQDATTKQADHSDSSHHEIVLDRKNPYE
jgi:serine/threonine-protein kinase